MHTEEVDIQPNMTVRLKTNAELLDEVMVVAYGTAKKSAFTGSAGVVGSEDIEKIQSSNVVNALNGKVSGVQLNNSSGQPDATTPTIRIRGISSINAGNDPLIILDGVPYDGDLNNISSQDIESMTVLKDAASSALYGARGANGVIIITTKKGTAGKAKITVDAKWGSNSRALPNYEYVNSPAKYYEMWYSALKNYFVNAQGYSDMQAHNMANQHLTTNDAYGLGYNVYSVPEGQYMIGTNGKLNPNATLGNVVNYNGQDYMLLPDDWTDAAYKTGLRQEYSLTATAGTDKSSFFASFNYLSNEGISPNSDYERIAGRLKADYQLTDWLKIGVNMGYTHFDANSLGEDGSSGSSANVFALTMMAPIYPLYLRDGQGYINLSANKNNMFDPTNMELDGAIVNGSSGSYMTDYNTEGYFGRLQYDFAEKYFGSVSYRRDASSRFHPDNRWGNFWSAGAAWIISKEAFFDVEWIDLLKIKASYGSQGNDRIGDYRYVNTFSIVNSNGNPAAVPNVMGNKDITWETNANFNAGVEFELLGTRLNGSVDFFTRKTSDMLFTFTLPPSYGYTYYYANIGDMRNLGVELELNGTVIKHRDLEWNINLNLTHYKNKVTYLADEHKTTTVDGVEGYENGNMFIGEGIPLYTYELVQYVGVNENGESLFYVDGTDENGNPTRTTTTNPNNATKHLCGTALPDVYGGFGTELTWKGLDFSANFSYQLGGQVYDSDYASSMSANKGHALHVDLLNAWSTENPTSNIPRLQYNDSYTNASSDRWLTSASYLSQQNITLGYTLPARWCRALGMEKLRIYATADNVWLWSKRQGLDPRQSISGSVTSAYYAPMRTISGGITLTF